MGTKKTDAVILQKKKEIADLKKKLGESLKFQPITNAVLRLNGTTYNLNVINIDEVRFLISQLHSIHLSATSLFDEPLKLEGFEVSDWVTDLWSRYHFLNRKNEEKRLEALEKRLFAILSADKKTELELEDILKEI